MVGTKSYFKINSGIKNKFTCGQTWDAVRNEETGLRTARDYVRGEATAPLWWESDSSHKLKGAVRWFLRSSVALSAQDSCYN